MPGPIDEELADDLQAQSLDGLIDRSAPINYEVQPASFILGLYGLARDNVGHESLGKTLAALFDLAVTALYLTRIPNSGWVYCDGLADDPHFTYPFVNACPRCSLRGEFHFVKAGKPGSARIGLATSTILSAFLDLHAKEQHGDDIEIRMLNDNGLVDALLLSDDEVSLFEIKSAPLLSFPLEVPGEQMTQLDSETGETVPLDSHQGIALASESEASMILDEELRVPIGPVESFSEGTHYDLILDWLEDRENLRAFVDSWSATFAGYADPTLRGPTYWLTNGCGQPRPRPADWPQRRSGTGFESISDGKSSVGLDRTDDVKKGIYQVLKISTHFKEFHPSTSRRVSAALVTNIHAVKHHKEYLAELENLIWTIDSEQSSHVLRRDAEETVIATAGLFNLFDALIAFTSPHFRDDFLEGLYAFD